MATSLADQKHEVEAYVYIEQAVAPHKAPHLKDSIRDAQPRVIYDNPAALHNFHVEYRLLPAKDAPPYKTDVTVYGGIIAKVFTDADAKVVKTWDESGLTWFGWAHKHKFRLSLEDLLDLYRHRVHFKVWNSKSKFAVKAKYDHPKAFRLPSGGRRTAVPDGSSSKLSIGRESSNHMHPFFCTPLRRLSCMTHNVTHPKTTGKEKKVRKSQFCSDNEGDRDAESVECEILSDLIGEVRLEEAGEPDLRSSKKLTKVELQELDEQKRIDKDGILQLDLNWSDIFGKNCLTKCASRGPRKDLERMRVSLHVGAGLMPEEWRRMLTPITITVQSLENTPTAAPLTHLERRERCKPAYVKFQFMNLPVLYTSGGAWQPGVGEGEGEGSTVEWNEVRVLLLGTMDSGVLLEYLRGPPMLLEVHDRDQRCEPKEPTPSLFGSEQKDSVLGTTAFTFGGVHHNPFRGREERFDPYGAAHLDLSDLLNGQTYHEFNLPVRGGPRKPHNGDISTEGSLPPGDYLQCGTVLKVKIELTYPLIMEGNNLITGSRNKTKPTDSSCPFVRCVYILKAGKGGREVLRRLLERITAVNLTALGLDTLPDAVQHSALSTYKLTSAQMTDPKLDIVTGFHVSDGEVHLVVLEGLKAGGLLAAWEALPRHSTQDDGVVRVLWNSSFQFSKRLYAGMDVDISCVHLHRPLSRLVRQSGLYLQDGVPPDSYQGLIRTNELTQVNRLSNAVKYDLFPTVDMMVGLSAEFGIPASFEDLALRADDSDEENGEDEEGMGVTFSKSISFRKLEERRRRRCTSLDNCNPRYNSLLEQRKGEPQKNFIQTNIVTTRRKAVPEVTRPRSAAAGGGGGRRTYLEPSGPPPSRLSPPAPSSSPVYNYSVQTLNSTEKAKESMRRRLAQDPKHRYSYCQQYHSRTVEPVNTDAQEKEREEEDRAKWTTSEGFRYPLVPSSLSSNTHPKQPHPSRIEDLTKPFEDNLLHWNRTRPTVDRLQFPWEERGRDFQLDSRPPVDFGVHYPPTIHLAGESRAKERSIAEAAEEEKWTQSLVVSDTRFHGLRHGTQTEQIDRGRRASSQIDKLQGLLKSPQEKHSLKGHSDLPALSTLHSTGLSGTQDSNIACDEGKGYRPGNEKGSLKMDRKVIPIS